MTLHLGRYRQGLTSWKVKKSTGVSCSAAPSIMSPPLGRCSAGDWLGLLPMLYATPGPPIMVSGSPSCTARRASEPYVLKLVKVCNMNSSEQLQAAIIVALSLADALGWVP